MFFQPFPLENWKCCLRSFGTFALRGVIEMMNLQMLYDRALAGEQQHLGWTGGDGKFRVASRTVTLDLPTIYELHRMSDNPLIFAVMSF